MSNSTTPRSTSKKPDSIMGRHQSPLTHFFNEFKQTHAKPTYNGYEPTYKLDPRTHKILEEIEHKYENDLVCMLGGIEALGYTIAIAGQNEDAGYDMRHLSDLGWFLSEVASHVQDIRHCHTEANYILSRAEVND